MTSRQLINEWREKHPHSSYYVREGAKCDNCKRTLTDDERWDNIVENEAQDGNMCLCKQCGDEA